MTEYKPQQLDKKWQHHWTASQAFEVDMDPARPKYYCLEMFAYPSGYAHVGHVRNYIIGDIMARTKRMRGYNVLHPFGWDAFGLPADEALKGLTFYPAQIAGLADRLGSIETGKRADLAALDAGGRVRLTLVGGRVAFDKL